MFGWGVCLSNSGLTKAKVSEGKVIAQWSITSKPLSWCVLRASSIAGIGLRINYHF